MVIRDDVQMQYFKMLLNFSSVRLNHLMSISFMNVSPFLNGYWTVVWWNIGICYRNIFSKFSCDSEAFTSNSLESGERMFLRHPNECIEPVLVSEGLSWRLIVFLNIIFHVVKLIVVLKNKYNLEKRLVSLPLSLKFVIFYIC